MFFKFGKSKPREDTKVNLDAILPYEYTLLRSDRHSMALEVKGNGVVVIRVPKRAGQWEIATFVSEHRDWIDRQMKKVDAARANGGEPSKRMTEKELEELHQQAKKWLPERCRQLAPIVGVSYGKVTIRAQRSKWGSCSANGNLNFNCLLMLMPSDVQDYVVVHELCHRLEMNHSQAFWAQVKRVMPGYEKPKKWLKQNGEAYMLRLPLKD